MHIIFQEGVDNFEIEPSVDRGGLAGGGPGPPPPQKKKKKKKKEGRKGKGKERKG